jgi:hypothetical protein
MSRVPIQSLVSSLTRCLPWHHTMCDGGVYVCMSQRSGDWVGVDHPTSRSEEHAVPGGSGHCKWPAAEDLYWSGFFVAFCPRGHAA